MAGIGPENSALHHVIAFAMLHRRFSGAIETNLCHISQQDFWIGCSGVKVKADEFQRGLNISRKIKAVRLGRQEDKTLGNRVALRPQCWRSAFVPLLSRNSLQVLIQ
jgi:hypothetical protein